MAFWGVEIKPGKPFTHTYDSSKGRLHISMATLGHGTAITKSTLQCNVGNRSPVYLCSLYPGQTESLQLNLELEEDGNVILSVLGPRSIHLCGYYLARGRYGNTMDDSESYGEDIANTETEKSDRSDEDDYDDSFINDDGDLAVFSASPISNEEEASSDGGRKSAKGSRRRLRKKYHLVESDDDSGLEGKKTVNDSVHVQSQEIDDEDSLPISSLCKKNKSFVRVLDQEMEDCFDKEAIDAGEKDSDDHENSIIGTKLKTDNAVTESQIHSREAEPSDQLTVPSTVPDVGDNKKSKKKKKGKEKETSTELDNAAQDEPKMNTSQDHFDQEMHDNIDRETVDAGKKDGEDHENSATETKLETDNAVADSETHREAEPSDHLVDPCTVPDVGDIKKSKKKKKGKEKETKSSSNGDSTELDNAAQDEPKMNTAQDLLDQEMVDNVDKEAVDDGKKDGEDCENITIETKLKTDNVVADIQTHREAEPSDQLAVPSTVPDVGDMKKSKKKKKGKEKETKSSSNEHSTDLDNAAQDEPKMNTDEDLLAGNEQHQQQPNDKKAETTDKILPSSQVGQGQDEKPKKKRKERSKVTLFIADDACISNVVNLPQGNEHSNQDTVNGDVKIADSVALPSSETDSQKKTKRRKKEQINKASHPEGDNRNGEGIIQDYKADKETAESDGLSDKFSEKKEQHPKLTIENVDNGAQDNPDGNQSEDKKVKKKKKKSKSQGSEVVNSDVPVSVEQSTEMMEEDGKNVEDTKPSQVRTLSNGLVIQELETGKENGKIATVGKKISINYTGKLKENGVVIESNAGEAPFKFRLGKGEVIEGWDIGLEGMRVGEKRRLVVPPSMTSKKDGESENIPPNSWLVYDFELVKVH